MLYQVRRVTQVPQPTTALVKARDRNIENFRGANYACLGGPVETRFSTGCCLPWFIAQYAWNWDWPDMNNWIDVARADEFTPGTCRCVDVDGVPVAVFNVAGNYYAIEALCSHEGELLCGGDLEGEEIVCPLHGSRFSLLTGEALSPPAYEPVATFPVRLDDGKVQVRDERGE
jgi:3-phenylpropionate/trans-cinnamate dioxygenase ferredoxin subunit